MSGWSRGGAGVKNRNIADNAGIKKEKLDQKSVYEDFSIYGAHATGTSIGITNQQSDGTVWDGTAAAYNVIETGAGNRFICEALVAQTLPPVLSANGLNVGCDQTNNDGLELWSGQHPADGRPFMCGVDPGFYFRCRFKLADASGSDFLHVGFRSLEPQQADYEDYQDMAALGWILNAAAPAINAQTILANAATVSQITGDTAADDTWIVFTTLVDKDGKVAFQINDGALTTAPAPVSFAKYTLLKPFFRYLQHGDLTGALDISHWDVGWGTPQTRLV